MEVMTMIEQWEDKIPEFENASVKVNGYGTEETVKILKGLIEKIGNIHEIVHYRKAEKIKYTTYINGEHFDVVVNGGITSGYVGTGSNGLIEILEKTGISKEQAKNVVHMNSKEIKNAVITMKYM